MIDANRLAKTAWLLLAVVAIYGGGPLVTSLLIEQVWSDVRFMSWEYQHTHLFREIALRWLEGVFILAVPIGVVVLVKSAYDTTKVDKNTDSTK